jgi:hypothetical protein
MGECIRLISDQKQPGAMLTQGYKNSSEEGALTATVPKMYLLKEAFWNYKAKVSSLIKQAEGQRLC